MSRTPFSARRSLGRLALLAAVAGAVVAAHPQPARAQIAAAFGQPLPSPDFPVGTISVRVIAGAMSKPLTGATVTLTVNGTPREARTDAAGRAQFADLPPGATVQAHVSDEDGKDVASVEFAVPADGGARLILTTKPFEGGAGGGAPFAGGEGGGAMPEPRQMSGEARPEQKDPSGQITVRVTYDDLADKVANVPVALVGYSWDDTVTYRVAPSDADGRAVFTDLDRSGGTAYYALALMPRGAGTDRLMSSPILLDSQVGMRLILSAAKKADTAPPVDDLARLDNQAAPTAPGKIRIALEGIADLSATVTLVDAKTNKPVGTPQKPELSPPDPTRVQGNASFAAAKDLAPGALEVLVHGGAGSEDEPLPDVQVRVVPVDPAKPTAPSISLPASGTGLTSKTASDGSVHMAIAATAPQRALVTVNGRELQSEPFDLSKTGGRLGVAVHWEADGRPQAVFSPAGLAEGQVVYAVADFRDGKYRSLPFQPLAAAGTPMSVIVYPRTLFHFQMHAAVEDELLAVQGRFEITNYAWSPLRAGNDGLLLPLPRGFKGGVVFDPDQGEVAVSAGEGFRVVRPIPPGGRRFHGGFSLPVDAGTASWAMDLPMGSYQSQLDLRQVPGMSVKLPPKVTGDLRTVPQGTFYVVDDITIKPKQSMVMSISGLPTQPPWRVWIPRGIAILVIGLLLGGLYFALIGKPKEAAAAATEAHRQKLLDELVALERDNDIADAARKAEIVAELERLWN